MLRASTVIWLAGSFSHVNACLVPMTKLKTRSNDCLYCASNIRADERESHKKMDYYVENKIAYRWMK